MTLEIFITPLNLTLDISGIAPFTTHWLKLYWKPSCLPLLINWSKKSFPLMASISRGSPLLERAWLGHKTMAIKMIIQPQ